MTMYILVAVIYWLLCVAIGWGQGWLEKYYLTRYKVKPEVKT